MEPLPSARGWMAIANWLNQLAIFGGWESEPVATNLLWAPDLEWTNVAPLPSALYNLAAVQWEGSIYVVGGENYIGTISNTFLQMSTDTYTWTRTLPVLPEARCGLQAVVLNNEIYAIGGRTEAGVVPDVTKWNFETELWVSITPMQRPRQGFGAVVVNNKIYAIGGTGQDNELLYSAEVFDPTTSLWSYLSPVPVSLYGAGCVTWDSKIYLMGGYNGLNISSEVYVFDTLALDPTWKYLNTMKEPRYLFGAAVLDGTLIAIGGATFVHNFEVYLNTTEYYYVG